MQSRCTARTLGTAGLLALFLSLFPPVCAAQTPAEPLFAAEGWSMTFLLVPVEYWDAPEGPHGHELPAGTVRLYRQGEFEPALTGRAGEPILLPPGDWVWTAEAPGYVSTFTNLLHVPAGGPRRSGPSPSP